MDLIFKVLQAITPLASLYIAFLTYKMNKQELERKRKQELKDNEKNVSSLPPRSKKKRSNR